MILINEWLPNPQGRDLEGEWIELWNSGKEAVPLRGFYLQNKNSQRFSLDRFAVEAGGYLVLDRTETKFSLVNLDGELALYRESERISQARFLGTAPEGKSFARNEGKFSFTDPTPSAANVFREQAALVKNVYPFGENLNPSLGDLEVIGLAFGVAIIFSLLTIFLLRNHHGLRELFFGGDQEIR